MNKPFMNANESWSLYDTVVVSSNVNTLFNGAGYFTSYAALAVPTQIPFFNVRNKSVGIPYCNFDSANKLSFAFHCYSIGISFESPLSLASSELQTSEDNDAKSNLIFTAELIKHSSFILKVGQDEKMVNTNTLMPSGQGIDGWQTGFGQAITDPNAGLSNFSNGEPDRTNRWKFAEPILIPRESSIEGILQFSPYAKDVLSALSGPSLYNTETEYPAAALIRVTLYGRREVQQRNQQHFS